MQFRTNATSQRSLGTRQADPKMYTRINDFTMAKPLRKTKSRGKTSHTTEMNKPTTKHSKNTSQRREKLQPI